MVSGLGRRHARAGWLHRHTGVGTSAPPLTPYEILGLTLKHEWDLSLSTVTIATGISSVTNLRAAPALLQATAGAQPTFVSNGLRSHSLNPMSKTMQAGAAGFSNLAGGELCVLTVAGWTTAEANKGLVYLAEYASTNALAISTAAGPNLYGYVNATVDSTMYTGASPGTADHLYVVRNSAANGAGFYVDGVEYAGGAYSATQPTAIQFGIHTGVGAVGQAKSRVYWVGIAKPAPTNEQLNLIGLWAADRFGITWTPL